MKKPNAHAIASAVPLSQSPARPADPITACNVCGLPSDRLSIWWEHDERDQPLQDNRTRVFIGNDHPTCMKAMEKHPRLYAEDRGDPGHFPRLCGPCAHRRGWACSHPDLKANGGTGLRVQLEDMLRGAIICGGRGRLRIINHALSCTGRSTP